jgi:hypothetical protein
MVRATISLPGAAFSHEDHRGLGGRNARELVVDVLHRGRTADQPAEAAHAAQLVAKVTDLGAQLSRTRHAREHRLQARQVDGLGQVVRSAQSQRLHGAFDAGVAGDEDGLDAGAILQVLEEVDAAAVGKAQVHEDHVGPLANELDARLGDAPGYRRGEPLLRREGRQGLAGVRIVIDDEHVRHR